MLENSDMLFITHCMAHNDFHCNFPLEFLRLGNGFKVSFLKENLTFC